MHRVGSNAFGCDRLRDTYAPAQPERTVMYLQYLLTLDDDGIELVTNVVQDWCKVHHVPLECELCQDAMRFAIGRSLAGEKSPVALSEAITIHMQVENFRHPSSP
jgi:hypothetical protein